MAKLMGRDGLKVFQSPLSVYGYIRPSVALIEDHITGGASIGQDSVDSLVAERRIKIEIDRTRNALG